MQDALAEIVGPTHVFTGADCAPWSRDWLGKYSFQPLAVARPANTEEVAALVRWANETGTPVVPVAGNTGLNGGTNAEGALMISLERMNRIRDLRPEARVMVAEAGVILSDLHQAAAEHDLVFPLTFGAKGSARVGGLLSTNAGGSNVLRYGNTRDLCLGLEVVTPTGKVMDILSELHKNNSGYDLRHLMIGAEGTLGIITAAVLKLVPAPRAYATAMVAVPTLKGALGLLNRLQEATGGMVEAFEYMPGAYLEAHLAHAEGARAVFDQTYPVNVMVEVGSTVPRDVEPGPDGAVPLTGQLEDILGALFEEGDVLDAQIAQNETQRREMWARREAAAEVTLARKPLVNNDIALPLDHVAPFLEEADRKITELDPQAETLAVAHLGDGNIHYTVFPSRDDAAHTDAVMELVEDITLTRGGSFSAEHGIGVSKLSSMSRRKNPVALNMMRAIKAALDPKGIMNPGKVLPD